MPNPTVPVVTHYDRKLQELVLVFPSSKQALAYQLRNCEARIFSNSDRHSVWLPATPEMQYFRASSSCGFIIGFESSTAAYKWSQNSILGLLHPHDNPTAKEVCIRSEWDKRELEKLLSSSAGVAMPAARQSPPQPSPQPPRYDPTLEFPGLAQTSAQANPFLS